MRIGRSRQGLPLGFRRTITRLLASLLTHLFRTLVLLVPETCDRWLAFRLAAILPLISPRLRRHARDNVARIYGDSLAADGRLALVDRVFDNLGRAIVEAIRMSRWSREELLARVRVHGAWRVRRLIEAGRGAIFLTGHYGNFELLAAVCGSFGKPVHAMARAMDDEVIEQMVNQTRERHNVRVIHKTSWRAALRLLRGGGLLGALGDQAVNTGGVMLDFLGHPAPTPLGVPILARQAKVPIAPCFITRDANDRFTVCYHAPLEVPQTGEDETELQAAAQRINDLYTAQIRHKPDEWLWMHRRWKQPLATRTTAPKLSRSLADD